MMKDIVHDYLRPKKKFPHVWCPGCGYGIIVSSIVRAIDSLGLDRRKVIWVSGIGCSSRAPVYTDFSSIHGTHGRALAFATGVKLANPDLTVIVISGDGDSLAIGGNHFIHAARRNLDVTLVLFDNNIYGMTGGQYSPTMPTGAFGATAPYGNIETPFDPCHLAKSAGANFVARGTVTQPFLLENYIKKGIQNKGFSVIDTMSPCPSLYSFYNKTGTGVKMMKDMHSRTISLKKAEKMTDEELKDKIVTGIFVEKQDKGYVEKYDELIKEAKRREENEELL